MTHPHTSNNQNNPGSYQQPTQNTRQNTRQEPQRQELPRQQMHSSFVAAVGGSGRLSEARLPDFIAVRYGGNAARAHTQPSESSECSRILSVLQPSALMRARRQAMRAVMLPAQPAPSPPSSPDRSNTPTYTTPRTTPPTGLLSPPASTGKTATSAIKPANNSDVTPAQPAIKQPLRLLDLSPSDLCNLLACSFPPDRHIRIPNVSTADVDIWESLHGLTRVNGPPEQRSADPLNHGFTYTYNSLTKAFIVQCMPTPYHNSVQNFFTYTARACLSGTPEKIDEETAGGLLIGPPDNIKGFKGIKGLRLKGTKVPDFSIRAIGTKYPAVAMECGFSEHWPDLLCDAGLLLTGTRGETRLVILVKLKERFPTAAEARAAADSSNDEDDDDSGAPAPRARPSGPGKHHWPAGIDFPVLSRQDDADTHQELLEQKADQLASWFKEAHRNHRLGRYPLIGKITAMARVYCRTAEAAYLRGEMGMGVTDAVDEEEENEEDKDEDNAAAAGMRELWPQITPIYRYTFITDDHPTTTTPSTTSTGTGSNPTPSRSPSTLHIPLHLAYPTSNHQHHAGSPIVFDLDRLSGKVLARAADMLVSRAEDRAAEILRMWKEAWDAGRGKRALSRERVEVAGKREGGGETMAGWKRQKRLEAEEDRDGDDDEEEEEEEEDGDEEWTPESD